MPQEQHIRSEAVQDIMTKVPHWTIRWGNTVIFLMLVVFLTFSWLIKYPDAIQAQAIVTTNTPPQKEYAQVGGKIKHILVANGDTIRAYQDLAVIENTAHYEDVKYLKAILDTITYSKESFDFPINDIPLLFLGEIDAAYATFENDYLKYEHNRRLQPFENKRSSQRFSKQELILRLQTLNNQKALQENELKYQESDVNRSKLLFEKGVISLQEMEQKELQYLQVERNFKNLNTSISQIREAINTSNASYKIEESQNKSEEIRLLRSTIQSYNQLKKAIYEWEMRYVLRSEIHGKVSFLEFWSINQEVQPGDLLFTIIPNISQNHLAKLKVPAFNSGKLNKGQKVYLMLESYPEKEYGKLQSEVSTISAIADGEGNYLIDVLLPDELVTTYGNLIPFQSEMTASAEIIIEDLRLLERFFYQIRGIFNG